MGKDTTKAVCKAPIVGMIIIQAILIGDLGCQEVYYENQ